MPKKLQAMSAAEYLKAIEALNLTAYAAGPILGISRRQSIRYSVSGHAPLIVARFLYLLRRNGIPRDWAK